MIRPEHQFYIRPDLRKAESTTAESVIRPKQLVRVSQGLGLFKSFLEVMWQMFQNGCEMTKSYGLRENRAVMECNTTKHVGNTAIESFLPTHFVLFPSALIWAVDGTICPAEYVLYLCCLRIGECPSNSPLLLRSHKGQTI
jgi:hypothetical protein